MYYKCSSLWTKTANKISFPFKFLMCIRMKIATFQSSSLHYCTVNREGEKKSEEGKDVGMEEEGRREGRQKGRKR